MKVKLKETASVQMGHSFRARLEPAANGNVSVIQMRDLTDDNRLTTDGIAKIAMDNIKETHLAQKDDLVFRSRGQTNTAAWICQEVGDTVVSAPLYRIRPDSKKILPQYLCWFINQPAAQAFLTKHAKGTAVKMVSKQALEKLEIEMPTLEEQRQIIELADLAAKEQHLYTELAASRKKYIQRILMQVASGSQSSRLGKEKSLRGATTPRKEQ